MSTASAQQYKSHDCFLLPFSPSTRLCLCLLQTCQSENFICNLPGALRAYSLQQSTLCLAEEERFTFGCVGWQRTSLNPPVRVLWRLVMMWQVSCVFSLLSHFQWDYDSKLQDPRAIPQLRELCLLFWGLWHCLKSILCSSQCFSLLLSYSALAPHHIFTPSWVLGPSAPLGCLGANLFSVP